MQIVDKLCMHKVPSCVSWWVRCHECVINPQAITGRAGHRGVLGLHEPHSLYKKHRLPTKLLNDVDWWRGHACLTGAARGDCECLTFFRVVVGLSHGGGG